MDILWMAVLAALGLLALSLIVCGMVWVGYWTRVGWRWARRAHYREEEGDA